MIALADVSEQAVSDDPEGLSDTIGALRDLILAGEHFRHTVAAYLGIGISETACMSYLAIDGTLTPRELADRIDLTPSAVTTLLDRLASAGMIVRRPHASDRRKTVVSITTYGVESLALARSWMRSALLTLSAQDLRVSGPLFAHAAAAMNEQSDLIRCSRTKQETARRSARSEHDR